jgi:hypothetical protein
VREQLAARHGAGQPRRAVALLDPVNAHSRTSVTPRAM